MAIKKKFATKAQPKRKAPQPVPNIYLLRKRVLLLEKDLTDLKLIYENRLLQLNADMHAEVGSIKRWQNIEDTRRLRLNATLAANADEFNKLRLKVECLKRPIEIIGLPVDIGKKTAKDSKGPNAKSLHCVLRHDAGSVGPGDPWDCAICGVAHGCHPSETSCKGAPATSDIFSDKQDGPYSTAAEPQSVYGCDPATVSLEGKLSPNGKPVRRVQGVWFREPEIGELYLWGNDSSTVRPFDGEFTAGIHDGPKGDLLRQDWRRIIVEEIQEPPVEPVKKAARMWLGVRCDGPWPCKKQVVYIADVGAHLHELPSLEDQKVLDELTARLRNNKGGSLALDVRDVVEFYLGMAGGKAN